MLIWIVAHIALWAAAGAFGWVLNGIVNTRRSNR